MLRRLLEIVSICAALASSYFWIRALWWRSRETINNLASSVSKTIADDFISQKAECKVALTGIVIVAILQFTLLFVSEVEESSGIFWAVIFVCILGLFYLAGDMDYRRRKDRYSRKYEKQFPSYTSNDTTSNS